MGDGEDTKQVQTNRNGEQETSLFKAKTKDSQVKK
jgi:hypothetical protein